MGTGVAIIFEDTMSYEGACGGLRPFGTWLLGRKTNLAEDVPSPLKVKDAIMCWCVGILLCNRGSDNNFRVQKH